MNNLTSWFHSLFMSEADKTRQSILSSRLKLVKVGDTKFYLRALPASFILELQTRLKGKNNVPAEEDMFEMLSRSICDSKGNPILSVEQAKELDMLMLNSLATEMMDFNALNPDAVEKAKAELKNLQAEGSTRN